MLASMTAANSSLLRSKVSVGWLFVAFEPRGNPQDTHRLILDFAKLRPQYGQAASRLSTIWAPKKLYGKRNVASRHDCSPSVIIELS
jgi:hypothetical protein